MVISLIKKRLNDFKNYSEILGVSLLHVLFDYFKASVFYGFTIWDYLEVSDGFKLSKYERKRFLTYKRMQKILSKVNNDCYYNDILLNKQKTLKYFSEYIKRKWIYPKESTEIEFISFVKNHPVLIVKPIDGMCGEGIFRKDYTNVSDYLIASDYKEYVEKNLLVEECIAAHNDLNLNNKSLNTFRIFTMIDSSGEPHVLKAKFRAGVGDSVVDAADGSIHYPISIKYGIIEGPGVTLEGLQKDELYYMHSGSEKILVGLKIPYWEEVKLMLIDAAKKIPQVRLVGWDVAITNNGPEIIEANHNPYHGTFEELGNERLWYPKLKRMV